MTDDNPRSERQAQASRINGTHSRGPTSPQGKARSAQNSKTHGLTGKLETTQGEIDEARRLSAALRSRFLNDDPDIAALIDRAITATLRLHRARTLITQALEDMADPLNHRRVAEQARYMETIATSTDVLSGLRSSKQLTSLLARSIAKESAHHAVMCIPDRNVITKLMQYTQRFRGERDRALARLEAALR